MSEISIFYLVMPLVIMAVGYGVVRLYERGSGNDRHHHPAE